jgi:zinc and cadmium transporter
MLWTILLSAFVLSMLSSIGLAFFYFRERTLDRAMLPLTALASGVLLGVAFLHILPTALGLFPSPPYPTGVTFSTVLIGVMVLFVLERVFYWHHLHEGLSEIYPFTHLNLFGDAVHNFINGMVMAAAFLISHIVGLMVFFSLFIHAIPQELSDFALLLHGGMKKWRALACSFASATAAILGALIVCLFFEPFKGFLLAFAVGGFIYIASVDLVPRLHLEDIRKRSVIQLAFFLMGVLPFLWISILA